MKINVMKTFQLSIPNPCHESWNSMSKQEQGRFCNKCQKTVFDFTGKSPEEIRQLLTERSKEKICGRFRNDQLSQPVSLEFSILSFGTRLNAIQVFLAALLLAFGTTLFSCKTHGNEMVGKIMLGEPAIQPKENYTTTGAALITDYAVMGDTISPVEEVSGEEKCHIKSRPEQDPDTLKEINIVGKTLLSEPILKGDVNRISEPVQEIIPVTVSSETTSTNLIEINQTENIFVYPNPTSGITRIKCEKPLEGIL